MPTSVASGKYESYVEAAFAASVTGKTALVLRPTKVDAEYTSSARSSKSSHAACELEVAAKSARNTVETDNIVRQQLLLVHRRLPFAREHTSTGTWMDLKAPEF